MTIWCDGGERRLTRKSVCGGVGAGARSRVGVLLACDVVVCIALAATANAGDLAVKKTYSDKH